jgi:hypothetical protein
MENIKLSEHFTLFELCITTHRQFLKKNIQESIKYLDNARKLCSNLLEPIRNYFNKPLIVLSGFRHPQLNKIIKGSKTSQHCSFEACDFYIVGISLQNVFKAIRFDIKPDLEWGQLISEGYSFNKPSWIHISLRGNRLPEKCQEVMISYDGGKSYIKI